MDEILPDYFDLKRGEKILEHYNNTHTTLDVDSYFEELNARLNKSQYDIKLGSDKFALIESADLNYAWQQFAKTLSKEDKKLFFYDNVKHKGENMIYNEVLYAYEHGFIDRMPVVMSYYDDSYNYSAPKVFTNDGTYAPEIDEDFDESNYNEVMSMGSLLMDEMLASEDTEDESDVDDDIDEDILTE